MNAIIRSSIMLLSCLTLIHNGFGALTPKPTLKSGSAPCGIATNCQQTCKCVTIPQRVTNQGIIPAANIFVRVSGKAHKNRPTLVFLHGYNGNAEDWQCQEAAFCKCYQTVALDYRGNVRSSLTPPTTCVAKQDGGIDYTMDVFSDDLAAVLTQLKITDNIILIGLSMGSGIAINYTARHPKGVRKIVLASGSPYFFTPACAITPPCKSPDCVCLNPETCCSQNCVTCYPFGTVISQSTTACIAANCGGICPALCDGTTIPTPACQACVGNNCAILGALITFTDRCTSAAQQQLLQNTILFDTQSTTELDFANGFTRAIQQNIGENALSENQISLLKKIKVPVLITYGSVDELVDPRNSLFLHKRIKGSKIVEFLDKSHAHPISAASQFNNLVKKFIKNEKLPKKIEGNCDVCQINLNVNFTNCGFPAQ